MLEPQDIANDVIVGIQKTQKIIIDAERDRAFMLPEYCSCPPDDMLLSNTAYREKDGVFERLCLKCDLWISKEHEDNHDRAFGFSGYDEANDND